MSEKREAWIDYIKVLACILVVIGHFFQSMVKANIIYENSFHLWFDRTIYYFHVPLFFICSGYLYQKYSKVNSWKSWKNNVLKKAINLGIPYFAFSLLTWVIKSFFASVTSNAIGGIVDVLFINPYPPYWYLYVLFFIFLVFPTMNSNSGITIILVIACMMKFVICAYPELPIWNIYAVSGVFSYAIWFVLGMGLSFVGAEKIKNRQAGLFVFAVFIGLSVLIGNNQPNRFIEMGMTAMACTAIFMIMALMNRNKIMGVMASYTMPVFLMHTLFAAPVRVLLVKARIAAPIIHIVVGLVISIIGPIVAIKVMEKIKIDFLVYPGRYIKYKK